MPARQFPETRPSIVRDALADDPAARDRARNAIAASYWTPIHRYLVRRWQLDEDDARDVTQDFFARALERDLFHRFDPARARLRTYLRLCVDSHVRNTWKEESRLKRGGGSAHVTVDAIADTLAADDGEQDAWFEREWMRALFSDAVDALEKECRAANKEVQFAVFQRLDIHEAEAEKRSTYAELSASFAIPVTQVTNYLAWARRRMRTLVLERLRDQCATEEEFRNEARTVFGIDP